MPRLVAAVLAALALAFLPAVSAVAQTSGTKEDHTALQQLKADALRVVNERDLATASRILHRPFMATVVTQDSFTDFDALKAHFDGLYTRTDLRMKKISMTAEADDWSQVFEGRFALTKGGTKERYELADGRAFDLSGRWTAVSIQEGGAWKLLAVHMGANFLDNPVLNAIEKSIVWIATGAIVVGLLVGLGLGWLIGRRRRPAAA